MILAISILKQEVSATFGKVEILSNQTLYVPVMSAQLFNNGATQYALDPSAILLESTAFLTFSSAKLKVVVADTGENFCRWVLSLTIDTNEGPRYLEAEVIGVTVVADFPKPYLPDTKDWKQ